MCAKIEVLILDAILYFYTKDFRALEAGHCCYKRINFWGTTYSVFGCIKFFTNMEFLVFTTIYISLLRLYPCA
jgi:hypothetical protein